MVVLSRSPGSRIAQARSTLEVRGLCVPCCAIHGSSRFRSPLILARASTHDELDPLVGMTSKQLSDAPRSSHINTWSCALASTLCGAATAAALLGMTASAAIASSIPPQQQPVQYNQHYTHQYTQQSLQHHFNPSTSSSTLNQLLAGSSSGPRLPAFLVVSHPDSGSPATATALSYDGPGDLAAASSSFSPVADVASEVEDKLNQIARQLEIRLDSAMGSVTDMLPMATAKKEDPRQADATAHALINEVWEVVDQNYLDARNTGFDAKKWARLRDEALKGKYSSTAAGYRAIREMMSKGLSDPYCRFITPDELSIMKKYDVTGVGLNLGTADEYVRKTGRPLPAAVEASGEGVFVVGISRGTASEQAGIRQGDELLQVDGRSLQGVSPFQAASLIQGQQQQADARRQAPSVVPIQVRRPDGSIETVTVERPSKEIATPVTSRLVKAGMIRPDTTGLLRLTSFNARAHRDLASAITQLEAEGAQSLVLDLRENMGGLVSEGLEVARLFLGDGAPIVITESRLAPPATPIAEQQPLTSKPLTVLVDDHTASAAEILAGALKDNCRAVLVGKQTYGKGLIQSVYELADGSGMAVTVGKYLTPNRTDIDRSGIQPNFGSQPTEQQFYKELDACRVSKEHDVVLEMAARQRQKVADKDMH